MLDTVVSVIQRRAQQKPQEAAWVAAFPPGELKMAAIENVTAMWALQDRQMAEARQNTVKAIH